MSWPTTDQQRRNRRRHQEETYEAPRYLQPWTPAQDRYLVDTTNGTVTQRAAALGRTYYAANARLARLRELGQTTSLEAERTAS